MTVEQAAKAIVFGVKSWILINQDRPEWTKAHMDSFIVGHAKKVLKNCDMFISYRSLSFLKARNLTQNASTIGAAPQIEISRILFTEWPGGSTNCPIEKLNTSLKDAFTAPYEGSTDHQHAYQTYRFHKEELAKIDRIQQSLTVAKVEPKPTSLIFKPLVDLSTIVNFKFS